MNQELLDYYANDEFVAGVWEGKYAIARGGFGREVTPLDMHKRMADELIKIETRYSRGLPPQDFDKLSELGKRLHNTLFVPKDILAYLDRYKWIIPQGSIMTMLGNHNVIGSLSNCFVIPSPLDSYGGIFKTDEQIAQLEKRRGGVGTNLNTLRPEDVFVSNAAKTSTGAHSFMDRYSSTTREVAQNGRRGALMLLMSCLHPDIFKFVTKKSDLTKVTGANVSTMLTDKFMEAALGDEDFICRFPINYELSLGDISIANSGEYNELQSFMPSSAGTIIHTMKIHAKELLDLIIEMAWQNGEPGLAFMDTVVNYSPEGVYEQFKPVASNPCGEQWMQAYDACRLLAMNLFSVVVNPYTNKAYIDYDKLREVAYIQQKLADDIVDLEIDYVQRIINKIKKDPQPDGTKATELELWNNVMLTAAASRRTGCGFTALGDMLAALGLKYDSDEAIATIKKVCKEKMRAELDCTIDLAITRGTFKGWSPEKEFLYNGIRTSTNQMIGLRGQNSFYRMMATEFPDESERMYLYGRRNVSWSTVAPTGTVSIVALLTKYPNTTAGIEPVYACFYFRNKKVNANDKNARVDFTDQNGDCWQTYPVVMGGLKEWIEVNYPKLAYIGIENMDKGTIEDMYRKSPYYLSTANDIDWLKRVEIQSVVQKYTTNAISSTLNLPNDVKKETVRDIYEMSWRKGLKGVTVYRDGCRTGVMTTTSSKKEEFVYSNSAKRPKELKADLHTTTIKGERYSVIVGMFADKPYEVFAFKGGVGKNATGIVKKNRKSSYDFISESVTILELEKQDIKSDEAVLTRLISGMLRHGANPKYVCQQIEKCNLEVVSYSKVLSRVLGKYTEKEEIKGEACPECGSKLRKEEGCTKCTNCSYSKC